MGYDAQIQSLKNEISEINNLVQELLDNIALQNQLASRLSGDDIDWIKSYRYAEAE